MPKTYIHVNQHKIRANKKHGTDEPVITVKKGKENTYCHEVKINGPSTVMYGGNEKPSYLVVLELLFLLKVKLK